MPRPANYHDRYSDNHGVACIYQIGPSGNAWHKWHIFQPMKAYVTARYGFPCRITAAIDLDLRRRFGSLTGVWPYHPEFVDCIMAKDGMQAQAFAERENATTSA